VGKNLGEAVGAYNSAVASMETRVLVSARRFRDLKTVPDGREIEVLEPVETIPRTLDVPELELQTVLRQRCKNTAPRRSSRQATSSDFSSAST
jgi:DNA anti-recombination protein RmuC